MPDSGMLGRNFEMQNLSIKVILSKFSKSIKLLVAQTIVSADLGVSGVRTSGVFYPLTYKYIIVNSYANHKERHT